MGADAVRSGRAGLLIRRHKSGASLRVVLRPSMQSGHETNDPLKSGPALAGPAGPATPPLLLESLILHGNIGEVEALLQRLGEGN